MSRYVPPALRNKAQPSNGPVLLTSEPSSRTSTTSSYTLDEIRNYYFPPLIDSPPPSNISTNSRTLHDSAASPGILSHILLFKDANPRWVSDGIIYTKSALQLLPTELAVSPNSNGPAAATDNQSQNNDQDSPPIDTSTASTVSTSSPSTTSSTLRHKSSTTSYHTTPPTQPELQPIAVYAQTFASNRSFPLFTFTGYYSITNLQFLAPHSPELIRMLDQKWTIQHRRSGNTIKKSRNKEGWDASLKFRWAIVKLAKAEEATKRLLAPKIEKLEPAEETGEKKGVNEMLRDMRLGGGKDHSSNNLEETAGSASPEEARQAPMRQPCAPTDGPGMFGFRGTKASPGSIPQAVDRFVAEAESRTVGVDETAGKNNWQAFAETAELPRARSGPVPGLGKGKESEAGVRGERNKLVDLT